MRRVILLGFLLSSGCAFYRQQWATHEGCMRQCMRTERSALGMQSKDGRTCFCLVPERPWKGPQFEPQQWDEPRLSREIEEDEIP